MAAPHPLKALIAAVAEAGSQRKFAREHGLSTGYVSLILNGRRQPGPKLLAALGLRKRKTEWETIE